MSRYYDEFAEMWSMYRALVVVGVFVAGALSLATCGREEEVKAKAQAGYKQCMIQYVDHFLAKEYCTQKHLIVHSGGKWPRTTVVAAP